MHRSQLGSVGRSAAHQRVVVGSLAWQPTSCLRALGRTVRAALTPARTCSRRALLARRERQLGSLRTTLAAEMTPTPSALASTRCPPPAANPRRASRLSAPDTPAKGFRAPRTVWLREHTRNVRPRITWTPRTPRSMTNPRMRRRWTATVSSFTDVLVSTYPRPRMWLSAFCRGTRALLPHALIDPSSESSIATPPRPIQHRWRQRSR
jgi:hypothetical protein